MSELKKVKLIWRLRKIRCKLVLLRKKADLIHAQTTLLRIVIMKSKAYEHLHNRNTV